MRLQTFVLVLGVSFAAEISHNHFDLVQSPDTFHFVQDWTAQSPQLIHSLTDEEYARSAHDVLVGYSSADLVSLLSFRKVYMERRIMMRDSHESQIPIVQELHRSFLIAVPEILLKVPAVGMAFIYVHGSIFYDTLFLSAYPRLAQPVGGPGIADRETWEKCPTGQYAYRRFPELETCPKDNFEAFCNSLLIRAETEFSLRLALLLTGFISQEARKRLVMISLENGEFDVAFAGLRAMLHAEVFKETLHGLTPRKYVKAILKLINIRMLDSETLPLKSMDLELYNALLKALAPSLETGYSPLVRFVLERFEVDPKDIIDIDELIPFRQAIGSMLPPTDLLTLNYKFSGNIPTCLALIGESADESKKTKLDKLLPLLGEMDSIEILLALENIINDL